jgi:prevent-host-death family protein
MAEVFPLTAARSRLGELVNRARFGRERVILTEYGTPVAALISVDELAESPIQAEAILAPHRTLLDEIERLAQTDQSQ